MDYSKFKVGQNHYTNSGGVGLSIIVGRGHDPKIVVFVLQWAMK
jgi:hypothetical protein